MFESANASGAWRGDDAVRRAALDALDTAAADQAGAVSLSRQIAGADEGSAWEERLGLPRWLAMVIDALADGMPTAADGCAAVGHVLREIGAGADLSRVGSAVIAQLLADPVDGIAAHVGDAGLAAMLADVVALQRRCIAGHAIAPDDWRALRIRGSAIAEALSDESVDGLAARCAEAACWNPANTRSVVVDTLYAWLQVQRQLSSIADGWGPEGDTRIKARLDELNADAIARGAAPGTVNVFALLEQSYPDEATALRAHMANERCEPSVRWKRVLLIFIERLAEAGERPPQASPPDAPALIARALLFADPARRQTTVSPDGRWFAWLASTAGVMNVWAAPVDAPDRACQLTFDTRRGIHGYSWTYLPGVLLFARDGEGDENWRLFRVDVESAAPGAEIALTPAGVRAGILSVSRLRRDTLLVTLNQRDPRYPDVFSLDLHTGALTLVLENGGFGGFVADAQQVVRVAVRPRADGGSDWLLPDPAVAGGWAPWLTFDAADNRASRPGHVGADGNTFYMRDSRTRDTAALIACSLDGKTPARVLAADPLADVGGTLDALDTLQPQLGDVGWQRPRLQLLAPVLREDVALLDQRLGHWSLGSRGEDDARWIVHASSDTDAGSTWSFERERRRLELLHVSRPQLTGLALARMQSVLLRARDGQRLVSYLTLPIEVDAGATLRATRPVPLVLHVHGGPWTRDRFGYDATHQWLANRGYAVLSVNFRGSAGFGKAFVGAGDREWGARMGDDLEDAVQWAVDRGIADPARLAIFGSSYGGFAVLSALTRFTTRYACGIDLFGPADLEALLAAIPPYWEAAREAQYAAIGDPRTADGRALLHAHSPLHRAEAIRTPLLIGQGANDPRVRREESERMVAALRARGSQVSYALFPDEGHGFVREANRLAFNAVAERFLARHLGGRVQDDDAVAGSSLQFDEG